MENFKRYANIYESFNKYVKIIVAVMALHNYIRKFASHDYHFGKIENDLRFCFRWGDKH